MPFLLQQGFKQLLFGFFDSRAIGVNEVIDVDPFPFPLYGGVQGCPIQERRSGSLGFCQSLILTNHG